VFEICLSRVTWLHRVPAGIKLSVLAVAGAAVFLTDDRRVLAGLVGFAFSLPLLAWLPLRPLARQVLPAAVLIAALVVFHLALGDADSAVLVAARLSTVILLAVTLTLTTRASAMVEAMERILAPLRFVGVSPAKAGFTLSLAIRFIPVLFAITGEIREAQKVRGLERSVVAVALPLLVRTLRMADDLSEAIAARAYDGD